jgi:periplasmic copper chaperone A
MKVTLTTLLATAGTLFTIAGANAHPTVVSGPAVADKSQEVHFGLGHGCDGADTFALRIEIPAGVTAVRPMTSDFGLATVEKDTDNNVKAVSWQKAAEDALDADTNFYKFIVRMRTPKTTFTQVYFPVHQTCRAADGTLSTVDWVALPGGTGEPAAALTIVPARLPGWNKYTVTTHLLDLTTFFQDALIVWRGNSAYSFNPTMADLIKSTSGVTTITDGIHPDDDIWVKY